MDLTQPSTLSMQNQRVVRELRRLRKLISAYRQKAELKSGF
jgi:hypothetical protein